MSEKDLLADADIPLREIRPLQSKDLVVSEATRVQFHARLGAGQSLEDTLTGDFWRLAAFRLHPSALIELEPADSSWWALLLCREASKEHAKVSLLMHVPLEPLFGMTVDDLPLGTSVSFLGPQRLWACFRGVTILKHSFSTKSDACAWLRESMS